MFSRINQIIYGGLAAVILGLSVWSGYQYQKIGRLTADNQTKAQTISQLETVQKHLDLALKQEQQAVIFQQKIANELKAKAESKREKVRVIFKGDQCANAHLPSGVIEQLQ